MPCIFDHFCKLIWPNKIKNIQELKYTKVPSKVYPVNNPAINHINFPHQSRENLRETMFFQMYRFPAPVTLLPSSNSCCPHQKKTGAWFQNHLALRCSKSFTRVAVGCMVGLRTGGGFQVMDVVVSATRDGKKKNIYINMAWNEHIY